MKKPTRAQGNREKFYDRQMLRGPALVKYCKAHTYGDGVQKAKSTT
jgi:hypothetical protein